MKTTIKAVGKLKSPEIKSLIKTYEKRLLNPLSWEEYDVKKKLGGDALKKAEGALLLQKIPENAFVIALDERGKNVSSPELADLISEKARHNGSSLIFIIGGADGLSAEVRQRANFILGFGKLTWPHMMIRLMLVEQLYRVQQIMSGHPYHKE